MSRYIDLTGQQFGLLTAIERNGSTNGCTNWKCKCICGNYTIVRSSALLSGHKQYCEKCQEKLRESKWRSDDRLYRTWRHMLDRCENPRDKAYPLYGGKGVKICLEWHELEKFIQWALKNGYDDDKLTLDRIDVQGNYEPSNCRWITNEKQQSNKRNNSILVYNGMSRTKGQWSKITGISRSTINYRLKIGWSVEKALTEPVKDTRFGSNERE